MGCYNECRKEIKLLDIVNFVNQPDCWKQQSSKKNYRESWEKKRSSNTQSMRKVYLVIVFSSLVCRYRRDSKAEQSCRNCCSHEKDQGEGYIIFINPLTANVPHHIETSQLICNANQFTGFCMMGNIGR